MAETSRVTLRRLLLVGYDELKSRLTRRLGSAELAGDALQDTFLRLECAAEIGAVNNPRAYLFRTALNVAADHRRSESRLLNVGEVDALLDVADETPGPARVAEARSDIEALKQALNELPVRCREIFLAVWVDGVPRQEVAERFGVSVRTIKIELRRAREHCAVRLDREMTKRFPSCPRGSSSS